MEFRRKSDVMLAEFAKGTGENPEQFLLNALQVYKKIWEFKSQGYSIKAYKEKISTYSLQDIKLPSNT
jgi:hypothetical protein